ncbi:MAG: FAD:protein FMN transferase [Runella slithyformis]|nr:MAG: FAD:protein FMN transferase [Runella slithyformis]
MPNRLVFIFPLLVLLCSCKENGHEYQKLEGKAQGTTYTITFEGRQSAFLKNQADSIFKVIDRSMSLWDSSSVISNFNKSADGQVVDKHFQNALQKSFEVHKQSAGAFDPTIGGLIKAWGFIRKNNLPLPTNRTIDSLKQLVGLEKITLIGNKVTKQNPNIELDFNAIAQGYTVDVLAALLENKGILNYLVEVGGEMRAKGKNSKGENWKVGIEKPVFNETETPNDLQTVLSMTDVSLATSGNYRNFVQANGKNLSHILNPKTGKPVEHAVVSVSVLAPDCTEADAWATAFMVLGKEKSIELAKQLDFEIQIISLKNNAFDIFQTAGFKKLIQ